MTRNPDLTWLEGSDDDLEEELREHILDLQGSIFGDPFEVYVGFEASSVFVELDANGRRSVVIVDEENGTEYKEILPDYIC